MRVFIDGITGQTGSHLADLCLNKNYEVFGLIRRASNFNSQRIDHIFNKLTLYYGDLTDQSSIDTAIQKSKPDVYIHCGAQSHVKVSFEIPVYTTDVIATGTVRVLESLRRNSPTTKFINLATSEMFGTMPPPQSEITPFHPCSIYACAKVMSYYSTINYRESYNMHCSNAIVFNKEGERRGETFVTRKITRAATRIKLGLQDYLYLGNLKAKRTWMYCPDACKALLLMANADNPDDYCISGDEMHSVEEFLEEVFSYLELDWKKYVKFDEKFLRPKEVDALQGDYSKINKALGWKPETSFKELVKIMVDNDLILANKELKLSL